jgi:6-phosphogluconolactonase (cycloisomerase 2 family)/predicted Zn-dependent protease
MKTSISTFLLILLFSTELAYSYEYTGFRWSVPEVYFHTKLTDTSGQVNSSSGESWTSAFERAMQSWTDNTNFTFHSVSENALDPCPLDFRNGAEFANNLCGTSFGATTLAVTFSLPTDDDDLLETDIVFNDNFTWDIYTGDLQASEDFYRVAVHELGHALGLGHEDNGTPSIMASTVSNIDNIQTDDITGVNSMYSSARLKEPFPIHKGSAISLPAAGFDFELDNTRNNLFISIPSLGQVVVVSTITKTISQTINTGAQPHGLSLSLDKTKLYVALFGQGQVAVIDTTSFNVIETIDVLEAINSENVYDVIEGKSNRVYVSASGGSLGLARLGMIKRDASNEVIRIVSDEIFRGESVFLKDPKSELLYLNESAHSPTSLYKFDISTDNVRLITEDIHGSLSQVDGFDIHPSGKKIAISGGEILSANTLNEINLIVKEDILHFRQFPQYSNDGNKLYQAIQNFHGLLGGIDQFPSIKIFDASSLIKQYEFGVECFDENNQPISIRTQFLSKFENLSDESGLAMYSTKLCFFDFEETQQTHFPLYPESNWSFIENSGSQYNQTAVRGRTDISGSSTRAILDSNNQIDFFEDAVDDGIKLHKSKNAFQTIDWQPAIEFVTDNPVVNDTTNSSGTALFTINSTSILGVSGSVSNLNYSATSTVEAFEILQTNLGQVNTIRIAITINVTGVLDGDPYDKTVTERLWLLDNVGIVKRETISTSGTTTYDLMSHLVDSEQDMINDYHDNCPSIANTDQIDTDNDTEGDACDADDDNDFVSDGLDAFPLDSSEFADSDGDGVGDNLDELPDDPFETVDSDGDGVGDNSDAFPDNGAETTDTDNDGIGNNSDLDDDGDLIEDSIDNCPLVSNFDQLDIDSNGIGNVCDPLMWKLHYMENKNEGASAPSSVVVSSDGNFVYATSSLQHSVSLYFRNNESGLLTFIERIEDDGLGSEPIIGVDGLWGASSINISNDGDFVYITAINDRSITLFNRNNTDGKLSFVEVIKDGVNGVDGLDGANRVEISPDDLHVYVTSSFDDAIVVFSRDPLNGKLTFVETIKDGSVGIDSLDSVRDIKISPDGFHVYVASPIDDAISIFSRNSSTGELTYIESITYSGINGIYGLNGAISIVISQDGNYLYAAGTTVHAITIYKRNKINGKLTLINTILDDVNGIDGLRFVSSINLSSDGIHAYTTSTGEHAVSLFSRDPASGLLTYVETKKDGVDSVDGLRGAIALASSPNSSHVYVAGKNELGLAVFNRDDYDGDGLNDKVEITLGTNPLVADTDNDGVNDGLDAFPLDPTETKDTDGDSIGDNVDTVFNINDNDIMTLIAAINAANDEINHPGIDVIELASNGTYQLLATNNSDNGNTGLPSITSEIVIKGQGSSIIGGADNNPCDGSGDEFRIFLIDGTNGKLTLNNTMISDGCVLNSNGGGVAVTNGGSLNLNNSNVINSIDQSGKGVYSNAGSITISR